MRDAVQRDLDPDLLDDVRDVAAEKRQLDVVAVALQVELLAQADGAERVDARVGRLAAPQQREAGAAAADFDQQRAGAAERGVPLEPVPDRQIDQAALFGLVDDVESDAGAAPDAIEEHVAVTRFADGAGRGGPDPADAVQLHRGAEPVDRGDHGVTGPRPDRPAGRERIATERHAPGQLLDNAWRLADDNFGDRQSNRAGAHVEHGDQNRCVGRGSLSSRRVLHARHRNE